MAEKTSFMVHLAAGYTMAMISPVVEKLLFFDFLWVGRLEAVGCSIWPPETPGSWSRKRWLESKDRRRRISDSSWASGGAPLGGIRPGASKMWPLGGRLVNALPLPSLMGGHCFGV
jgi:hypothetical protein